MKYVSGSLYISQILLIVHQNPSRTPTMAKKKFSEQKLLQILQKQHHCNKTPMATKQFSRYPSTKFHKQANAHSKRNLWNCTYTPTSFFFIFQNCQQLYKTITRKKNRKKQKKQIKIFKKKQKKKPNTGYKDS